MHREIQQIRPEIRKKVLYIWALGPILWNYYVNIFTFDVKRNMYIPKLFLNIFKIFGILRKNVSF